MKDLVDVFWHEHTVYQRDGRDGRDGRLGYCKGCLKTIEISLWFYRCDTCYEEWHSSCVPSSPEDIKHPCHPKHPLALLLQGPPDYSDGKCKLCQRKLSNLVHHCKSCDFSVCMNCTNDPPPLTIDHPKCHEHAVTLMPRDVSFTCNTCGTHGEGSPYVCLPCSFMFHYDCVNRPHVININRHEHRITHTSHFSLGNRVCDICRQDINWRYGAYSSNKCTNYFVHSKCATRRDVWDGVELKGIPEEEVDTTPFKVITQGVINHFSHEVHNLFLIEEVFIDGGGDGIFCEACCQPISFERYYCCMECEFVLHEDCANFPLQKRHGLSTRMFSFSTGKENKNLLFHCGGCGRAGNGFRYSDGDGTILDVHCAFLSLFRHRKLHPHTLFLTTTDPGPFVGSNNTVRYMLNCVECKFYSLNFERATLPVVIKHRCDDHYLFLSSGEKEAAGEYWCEICEAETSPIDWFYTCYDCGVVCHIDCVTGDTLNIKPGFLSGNDYEKLEVVLNDRNTRPLCSGCNSRCRFPMVYKFSRGKFGVYVCSFDCIYKHADCIYKHVDALISLVDVVEST